MLVFFVVLLCIILFDICSCLGFFFLFKQKTAYEMRISDWSSDVCSSDLLYCARLLVTAGDHAAIFMDGIGRFSARRVFALSQPRLCARRPRPDRKSVV